MDSTTIEKALGKLGCEITPGSRHRKCKLVIDGVLIGLTTLPQKPKRVISRNWIAQIKRAVCIESDDELLDYGRCRRTQAQHRQSRRVALALKESRPANRE
jgi:hypothetical protein